jgi:hypothetical protein
MAPHFDLELSMSNLKQKRAVFHSEADFQFALAWEIQLSYPEANIRLEYCPNAAPNMHIDIIVSYDGGVYPIELKYKTHGLNCIDSNETYTLKNHGAQDIGKYDCLLDVQRVEFLSHAIPNFELGYVIWLTNDPLYWKPLMKADAVCRDFSLQDGIVKNGRLSWASNAGSGTTKGREKEIALAGVYPIHWTGYSNISTQKYGEFRYAIVEIPKKKA